MPKHIVAFIVLMICIAVRCQDEADITTIRTPPDVADFASEVESMAVTPTVDLPHKTAVSTNGQVPNQLGLEHAFYKEYVLTGAGQNGFFVRTLGQATENTAVAKLPLTAFNIAVHDNVAYVVSCERNCIRRVNLNDPIQPKVEDGIYETGHMMPISKLHIEDELLYVVVRGVEVQILDEELKRITAVSFSEPVADLEEIIMKRGVEEPGRYLNLAVPNQGIYGFLIPENPAQIQAVGFYAAPRPAWHLPESGTIISLLAIDNIMIGGAGSRGIREFLKWDNQYGGLLESDFDYFAGEVMDLAWGDSFIYVLSEGEGSQMITALFFEKTQDDAWNANRWLADELTLASTRIEQIEWHQGQLWAVQPFLQPITGLATLEQMMIRVAEEKEIYEAQNDTRSFDTRLVYKGQLGGAPQILAQKENYVYVGNYFDLLIYDAIDPQSPVLVNRQQFNEKVGEMRIFENTAVLSTLGFEQGSFHLLDLSNSIEPLILNTFNGTLGKMEKKDNFLLIQNGYFRSFLDFIEIKEGYVRPVSEHPLMQVHIQTAVQIEKDTNGLIMPDDDTRTKFINDFLLIDDLLIVSWYDNPGCIGDDESIECVAGIVLFDLSNTQSPKLLSSQLTGVAMSLKNLDEYYNLSFSLFPTPEHTTLNIAHLLPQSFTFDLDNEAFNSTTFRVDNAQIQDFLTDVDIKALGINGTYAYIADDKNRMSILDLSTLPYVELVTQIELDETLIELVVSENLLIARSETSLSIYHLLDPVQPFQKELISYAETTPYLTLTGRWIVRGLGNKIIVEDIEPILNGGLPVRLSETDLPSDVYGKPAIYENMLYVYVKPTHTKGVILMIDLVDLEAPKIVGSIDEIDAAVYHEISSVEIKDGVLYVGCSLNQYCLFDIQSSPARPVFLNKIAGFSCGGTLPPPLPPSNRWELVNFDVENFYYATLQDNSIMFQTLQKHPCHFGHNVTRPILASFKDYLLVAVDRFGLLFFQVAGEEAVWEPIQAVLTTK